jgi:peptide/nickel transport system permease protein
MTEYIVRRLLLAFFIVWIISMLSFFILELPPGNAIERVRGYSAQHVDEGDLLAMEAELRAYLALDRPQYERYANWIWKLIQGDFGRSIGTRITDQRPVKELVGDRIALTVALTGFTILITWTFAIPVGIYSAVRQHSVGDYIATFVGFSGLAVPDFLLGLVLMYLAYAYLGQSVGGLFSADYSNAPWTMDKVWDLIKHLWIPALVLGTSGTASLIRIMRNNLLDELGKPYVVTARAKGLSPLKLILKYPVRVAVNPLVSTVGYLLPSLVSGSVIVSVVLSLPTIGPVLLTSIQIEDIYVAGFIVFVLGVLTVVGTLLSDIALAIVDPRIRLGAS